MRPLLLLIGVILFFLFHTHVAFAQSEYVLPYPSSMPGSKFYTVNVLWDELMKYWHFGSMSQFRYNLEQSDKYLVEAKTLFEYKQYLLALQALEKSDDHFLIAKDFLKKSAMDGKDISEKNVLFQSAARKHIDVLSSVSVPQTFVWQPEKQEASTLHLQDELKQAIEERRSCL